MAEYDSCKFIKNDYSTAVKKNKIKIKKSVSFEKAINCFSSAALFFIPKLILLLVY